MSNLFVKYLRAGILHVEKLYKGGVEFTVTAAELNLLSGLTASASELNHLDGITADVGELNVLDGILADVNELNILNGVTASTAEINLLVGLTASSAELNILDGATVSTAELNLLVGLTAEASELNILDGALLDTAELNLLNGVVATTAEINAACDVSARAEVVAATNVIGSGESGKTFYLNAAGGFVSTLPAPAIGLEFEFFIQAAPSGGDYTITTDGGANIIIGGILEREVDTGTDGPYSAAADTIHFEDGIAVVGDWVKLRCNGTSWYLVGVCNAHGAITLSAT